ncbi:hypothetical protein E5D57_010517 [Metarhizium anisopliae]|nr:hypothetical protein E5D57_010517 [Metarhizium anisopliae]
MKSFTIIVTVLAGVGLAGRFPACRRVTKEVRIIGRLDLRRKLWPLYGVLYMSLSSADHERASSEYEDENFLK